jgi:thioredoxin-dependent peroxiredoxin
MEQRPRIVTMKGKELTLEGDQLELGQKVPQFEVTANDLSKVKLSSFSDKIKIILSVPSLDTSVCDTMSRRFNSEAANFSDDIVVLVISMDLPFAQKRWCGNGEAGNVITLSDHYDASFGIAYGVLIKELRLLARSVFIIDRDNVLRYWQLVPEISNEPDYEAALQAVEKLTDTSISSG